MKTKEEILEIIESGKQSQCLDSRDYSRLCDFFSVEQWPILGFELKENCEPPIVEELTEENVLKKLESDLDFAFEKALNKRGISSSFMYEVIKMWMWILDDPLQDFNEYAMYGLPLYKAVALKYNFPNPIGSDDGSESKYDAY